MLMSLLDPEGALRHRGRRLKRRVYQNKVRQDFNIGSTVKKRAANGYTSMLSRQLNGGC